MGQVPCRLSTPLIGSAVAPLLRSRGVIDPMSQLGPSIMEIYGGTTRVLLGPIVELAPRGANEISIDVPQRGGRATCSSTDRN